MSARREDGAITARFHLGSLEGRGLDSLPGADWRLHAVGPAGGATYSLGDGEHLIGRASDADVRFDDESISRRHAILRIGRDEMTIEDLGSMNGTRVRDHKLRRSEAVSVSSGESFEVGKVLFVLRRRAHVGPPRRRFYDHSYIESRLDEEVEKRGRSGGTVTLARLHIDGSISREALEQTFQGALTVDDLVGEFAPGELEVLLLDQDWDCVERTCDEVVRALRAKGVDVDVGFAIFPHDGRSASALLSHANAELRGSDDGPAFVSADGADGAMDRLQRIVERVATSDISIVLHGETGVGKEVLARELHRRSPRAKHPLVGLNCAALTETLLESELFGHERGAFSGAVSTKPGLFEVAEKGTVFLDEIGEMSLAIQAKLLRVLEERTVLRVGGLSPRKIDVRFIAASHRDLEAEVASGRFRQDLYFRLNGITLEIPPLRDRKKEIEALTTSFIADACRRSARRDVPHVGCEASQLLLSYPWPGNIRELRNVVERAVLLCTGSRILPEHLPVEKMVVARARMAAPARTPPRTTGDHLAPSVDAVPMGSDPAGWEQPTTSAPPYRAGDHPPLPVTAPVDARPAIDRWPPRGFSQPVSQGIPLADQVVDRPDSLRGAVQDFERQRIADALRSCGGNQTRAAEMLGVSRRTLLNRLDQYGLPRPRKGG